MPPMATSGSRVDILRRETPASPRGSSISVFVPVGKTRLAAT